MNKCGVQVYLGYEESLPSGVEKVHVPTLNESHFDDKEKKEKHVCHEKRKPMGDMQEGVYDKVAKTSGDSLIDTHFDDSEEGRVLALNDGFDNLIRQVGRESRKRERGRRESMLTKRPLGLKKINALWEKQWVWMERLLKMVEIVRIEHK